MRKFAFFSFLAFIIFLNLTGCVPLIAGGAVGAVSGYAVSQDTVKGDMDKSFDGLFSASQEIARSNGTIKRDDYAKGTISFIAQDSSLVWIKISRITQTASRLKVSSRRYHLPNLTLAQELFTKIVDMTK